MSTVPCQVFVFNVVSPTELIDGGPNNRAIHAQTTGTPSRLPASVHAYYLHLGDPPSINCAAEEGSQFGSPLGVENELEVLAVVGWAAGVSDPL